MSRIVCFGELLLRLAPPGRDLLLQTENLQATFAGAEANVAVALARLGHATKFLSVFADNAIGRAAAGELRRHGVDTSALKFTADRMGLFFLTPGAVRRPSEIIYDRTNSAFARAPELCSDVRELDGASSFHISGVTPALGRNCADAAIKLARAAADRGLAVSFDGNYRAKLWEHWQSEAPAILRQLFECADIVFGDDRDVALVLGLNVSSLAQDNRHEAAAKAAFDAFPRLKRLAFTTRSQTVVDRLDYGAKMFTRTAAHTVPPVELSDIVDRVGTGDAFAAGVIHGLLTKMSDVEALKFGHAAACLKHSIRGDFFQFDAAAVHATIGNASLDVRR